MAYVPVFVQKAKILSKLNKLHVTAISDEDLESGELRLILDLADPILPIGCSVSYQDLLTCDTVFFQPLLEQAGMFATIAELNSNGVANITAGPITSASGDGMAKTHGYYSSKKVNDGVLVGAEERYLKIVKSILTNYKRKCLGRRQNWQRVNPSYAEGYNINKRDIRRTEGNPL